MTLVASTHNTRAWPNKFFFIIYLTNQHQSMETPVLRSLGSSPSHRSSSRALETILKCQRWCRKCCGLVWMSWTLFFQTVLFCFESGSHSAAQTCLECTMHSRLTSARFCHLSAMIKGSHLAQIHVFFLDTWGRIEQSSCPHRRGVRPLNQSFLSISGEWTLGSLQTPKS